jgi:hypothetical protein
MSRNITLEKYVNILNPDWDTIDVPRTQDGADSVPVFGFLF